MNFEKYYNSDYPPQMPNVPDSYECYEQVEKEWQQKVAEYNQREFDLFEQFKKDLFCEFGISDNPKREMLFDIAWEDAAEDFEMIYVIMSSLVKLIKE